MSDNRRRLICRLLFVLLCVLPTTTVCYQILHPPTPHQWQQLIQAQLGVHTSIDSIETPKPHVTILRGFKLEDPELGPLFEALEVKITLGETNLIEVPHSVRVTNRGIIQLVKAINEHLLRAHAADRPWRIHFLKQTTIEESILAPPTATPFPRNLIVHHLQVDVVPLVDGTMTQMRFQLPDAEPDQWVCCSLSRSQPDAKQTSHQRLELDTAGAALPCWLLADLVPEIQNLGPDCHFVGQVDINPRSGNPYGWFTGIFTQIDPPGNMMEPPRGRDARKKFTAEVEICSLDGEIKKLEAHLIHPDGSRSRIARTIEVIQRFDVVGAIRTAAQSQPRSVDTTPLYR